MMSEARRRANDKYIKENYKKLNASYANEFVDEVKEMASKAGVSFATYIQNALVAQMVADGDSEAVRWLKKDNT